MNRELTRKENYKRLRQAGFNVKESNYFKGRSQQNVVEMCKIKAMYDVINPKPHETMHKELWDLAEILSDNYSAQQIHRYIIKYLKTHFINSKGD